MITGRAHMWRFYRPSRFAIRSRHGWPRLCISLQHSQGFTFFLWWWRSCPLSLLMLYVLPCHGNWELDKLLHVSTSRFHFTLRNWRVPILSLSFWCSWFCTGEMRSILSLPWRQFSSQYYPLAYVRFNPFPTNPGGIARIERNFNSFSPQSLTIPSKPDGFDVKQNNTLSAMEQGETAKYVVPVSTAPIGKGKAKTMYVRETKKEERVFLQKKIPSKKERRTSTV